MINVNIEYRDGSIAAFTVEGHAGYAQSGSDIYCAGVSAIAQTTLLGLLNQMEQKPRYIIEKGYLLCELPDQLSSSDRERARVILNTMETGLKAMQEAYGEYLNITIRRL